MISPAEDKSDTQKNNKVSMWQAGLAPGAPYSVCIFHLCYIQLSDKCGRKENEKRGLAGRVKDQMGTTEEVVG